MDDNRSMYKFYEIYFILLYLHENMNMVYITKSRNVAEFLEFLWNERKRYTTKTIGI
jgi:hypothetical protein